eukprot:6492261-Amphidinium_carterae.2
MHLGTSMCSIDGWALWATVIQRSTHSRFQNVVKICAKTQSSGVGKLGVPGKSFTDIAHSARGYQVWSISDQTLSRLAGRPQWA